MVSKIASRLAWVGLIGSLAACGPARDKYDGGSRSDSGTFDDCQYFGDCPDGSVDGGDGGGGGGGDSGVAITYTIGALRANSPRNDHVILENVVVHSIAYSGYDDGGYAGFWVVDPASPEDGLWVQKNSTDLPIAYTPAVGDKVTLDGYYGTVANYKDRRGYRRYLHAGDPGGLLSVTKVGTATLPAANQVDPATLGKADGGGVSYRYASTRIKIPGPVTITNANPPHLRRYSYYNPVGYDGFEVSGGILVDDYMTYKNCDFRKTVLDGGSVTFSNGISGVWDTYTHAPCIDAGAPYSPSNCYAQKGYVPGLDASTVLVLYPIDCSTDLVP